MFLGGLIILCLTPPFFIILSIFSPSLIPKQQLHFPLVTKNLLCLFCSVGFRHLGRCLVTGGSVGAGKATAVGGSKAKQGHAKRRQGGLLLLLLLLYQLMFPSSSTTTYTTTIAIPSSGPKAS
jgi:hypothetical protein